MVKQQNQSGCLLVTLKDEGHAHASKSKSFTVKRGRNNGGSGENARLLDGCARDEREEGGEDTSFLYSVYHCRKPQTDSDSTTSTVICHRPLTAGSSHKSVVILTFTAGSWPPQSFSDFEAQNRH